MQVALSIPNSKQLAVPLFMTFGLPLLAPVIGFSQAWATHGTLPFAAGLPILSLLFAYLYFPLATARKRFFDKSNTLKSVLLGLAGFEIYRQLYISVYKASGASASALIQKNCSGDVETLQAAIACGAATSATLFGSNLFIWLVPAIVLCSITRRRLPTPLERSEA